MKEYKYKINGNNYTVAIGDIDDHFAQVEVNGVPYKVELDRKESRSRRWRALPSPWLHPHRHRRKK